MVYLQHGIADTADTADTWIMNSEELAPAFILANQGFDVWVGNNRGNVYSRKHQTLSPDSWKNRSQFWDFSLQEMADFDVTANIDFILKETGKRKLAVIAHSMGPTQMLVRMADDNSWWNERVEILISLAGVVRFDYATSLPTIPLARIPFLLGVLRKVGLHEILGRSPIISKNLPGICRTLPFV